MSRFFSADMHFGHANIIRYCDRPFADVDAMNAELIDRWNDAVRDDDEVYVLGDVALGTIAETLPLVGRLRGTKRLVPGNHDRCWSGNGAKAAAWVERYLDAGFASVLADVIELELDGTLVLACHFPYRGDSHAEERFLPHRPTDDGRVLLHGHVHTMWRVNGGQINVGCDVWDYRPVAEEQLTAVLTPPVP